jgi:hypothetical protein
MGFITFGNFRKVVQIPCLYNEQTFIGEDAGFAAFLDYGGIFKALRVIERVHNYNLFIVGS